DGSIEHGGRAPARLRRAAPCNIQCGAALCAAGARHARRFTGGDGDLTTLEEADFRFGFQRLHEDLGHRVTVSLDGFSGSRVGTTAASAQSGSSQIEADVRL